MKKLNKKFSAALALLAALGVTSSALANQQFRMHPKGPVVEPAPRMTGYLFGYGGITFGSGYNNTGSFSNTTLPATITQIRAAGLDPFNIPINYNTKDGTSFGGGVGLYSEFLGGTRFEFEGSVDRNDVGVVNFSNILLPGNFEFKTTAVMVNFLKEIPIGAVTGYTGFGVGHANTEMKGQINGIGYDDESSGFAWQFIAGVDIPVSERLALFTQYRYRVLSDLTNYSEFQDFSITTDDQPSSHSVLFGLRVSF